MTARDEAERAIADVLESHRYCESAIGPWRWCYCGLGRADNGAFPPAIHRAHIASVLADLMAERQAEAWDDAKDKTAQAYQHGGRYGAPRNPYRPDPKDTRDE